MYVLSWCEWKGEWTWSDEKCSSGEESAWVMSLKMAVLGVMFSVVIETKERFLREMFDFQYRNAKGQMMVDFV